ncbi:MAG TPA: shikimate dehydrogenase [Bacteroidales bacterium]|nr:shikimate dehydrogenase [Bacteroidales bacterium]HOK98511.1 shikimate dehydrogenase [Bacteroidales bacterium]HPO65486.1 shikimate dehydrogenase [Bacteroidales bacterium]
MRTFGLIGYPLEHSFSARYFAKKFEQLGITDAQYLNFPIENIELFPALFEKGFNICGLNVTIPYKEAVIQYLHELSDTAKAIGAVNTIKISTDTQGNRLLKGYNTDEYGFRLSLLEYLKPYHTKALILGTGGAAKAVEYVLKITGISYLYVSRNPKHNGQIGYNALSKALLDEYLLIINTTPVGMYPHVDEAPPIPYEFITDRHLLYDLIYNPECTQFLSQGAKRGATIVNGNKMLVLQAEKAWEIWNSIE